jgi:hypothetical protein
MISRSRVSEFPGLPFGLPYGVRILSPCTATCLANSHLPGDSEQICGLPPRQEPLRGVNCPWTQYRQKRARARREAFLHVL